MNDARSRFDATRVDASKADFSDRLDDQKQSYIVSTRSGRRSKQRGSDEGADGFESEEDNTDEGLARRIARLNREIEEVRHALQQRDGTQERPAEQTHDSSIPDLTSLTRALDSIQVSQRQALSAHARLAAHFSQPFAPAASSDTEQARRIDEPPPEPIDTATLSQLAAFDSRLASLESALGLDATDTPATAPVLPTLSLLDKQISLLTSPSALTDLQAKLTAAQSLSAATSATLKAAEENPDEALSPHDLAQLRALHTHVPTLTQLAPTVGPLLTRLRSLRYLHADAAGAKEALDDLQRRQDETDKELREWGEGLAAVEAAVGRAEEGFKGNADKVEKWVAQIEERLKTV